VSLYTLGEVAQLQLTTYNLAGVATDATTVVLTITAPDGTTSTPAITHTASTGIYTVAFTPTMLGRYKISWVAAGANSTADTHVIDVYGATIATPGDLRAMFAGGAGTSDLSSTTRYPDTKLRAALRAAVDQWNKLAGVSMAPFARLYSTIGCGQRTLALPNVAIRSIASLKINAATIDPSLYYVDPDTGVITLTSGVFTLGKAVSVFYDHGLEDPPGAVVDAVLQRAAELVIGSSVPARAAGQASDLGYTRFTLAGKDGSTGIADFDSTAARFGRQSSFMSG
jgi:hypothetical protein